MFEVVMKRKVEKQADKIPDAEKIKLLALIQDLKMFGPVLLNWPNYGLLKGTDTHHCHLSRKWVACWIMTKAGIQLEVTYVGSREGVLYARH